MLTALVAWLLAAVGLAAVLERLRGEFAFALSIIATLLVFGATPLFWYTVYEPSAALTGCFAATSILLLAARRVLPPGAPHTQRFAAVLGAAAVPTIVLVVMRSGAPSDHPIGWVDTLFSSSHGVLSWNPVLYLAFVGMLAYGSRDRGSAVAAVAALGILAPLIAWRSNGVAFGGAPFIAMAATLAPGLALLLDALRMRPAAGIAGLVTVALVWNYLLMVQYTIGLVPKNEPVSFARVVRQQAEVQTQPPFFYPFAFPANVWFAWREGLPVDRYDLLAIEPRRDAVDLALDRQADRFLLDGWDAPGNEEWGSVWWIGSRRATLTLPLALPRDRETRITLVTRTRVEEPTFRAMEAEVGLEVNGTEIGRFIAPTSSPGEAAFTIPAAASGRTWRDGFNRLTFVSHGVRPVDPADTRAPGPLASRRGSAAWPVGIYRIQIRSVQ
jgi:hypothetical protein